MNQLKNQNMGALADQIAQLSDAIRLSGTDAAEELRRCADRIEGEVQRFCDQAHSMGDTLNEAFDMAEAMTAKVESMFFRSPPARASHTAERSGLADAAANSSEAEPR